jgi:D-3-phosphoglycerate dehydrogenase / 2-oxoglutarate reductase
VREVNCQTAQEFVNLVTLRGGGHSISATIFGSRSQGRIVRIDDHITEVPIADHLLVVRNDDRPGVIGVVGTMLGAAGLNIADMDVGRTDIAGSAVMIISTTEPVPAEMVNLLRNAPGVVSVHPLSSS